MNRREMLATSAAVVAWLPSLKPAIEVVPLDNSRLLIGKTDSLIMAGCWGYISLWAGEPGRERDTGENIDAHSFAGTIAAGKRVVMQERDGQRRIIAWEA